MNKSPSRSSRSKLRTSPYRNRTASNDPFRETSGRVNEESRESNVSEGQMQQYFSFSRDRKEEGEESLPAFPPELEIDSLINEHQQ